MELTVDFFRFLFAALMFALVVTKVLLELLNLRHAKKNLGSIPEGFEGQVNRTDMARIQDYTSAKTKVETVRFAVYIGLVILLIFGGFLNLIASKAQQFSHYIPEGLVFFLIVGAIYRLVSIPFEILETFHIEKTFGFNRQTVSTWLSDFFKTLLISVIVGGILLSLILTIVEKTGPYWWFYSWVLFLAFGIVLSSIYPVVIAPLFNKFTPIDNENLLEKIKSVVGKSGIKVKGIFKMDAGKRSSHTNAYFTGLGRSKRIVLFDTLLERMEDDEIVSIVAHEAGHWKKRHLLKSLAVSGVYSLTWFIAAGLLLDNSFFYEIFFVSQKIPAVGLLLMAVVWEPVNFFLSPLLLAYSRKNEREADDAVFEMTFEVEPFKKALVKLTADNLANLNPHPAYVIFNYSHPPVTERISRFSR